MATKFLPTIALPPDSELYQDGRLNEDLTAIARHEVGNWFYLIIGSWRSGRTTTLRRLEHQLVRQGCCTCALDFIACRKEDTLKEVALYIKRIVLDAVKSICGPDWTEPNGIGAWYEQGRPSLDEWLRHIRPGPCLVLLIEGLDNLAIDAQQWLTNQLHLLATTADVKRPGHVRVILFGGIEVYDLVEASGYNSRFDHVFQRLSLNDFTREQTETLLRSGLKDFLPDGCVPGVATEVYEQVGGHPYLTQRFGAKLAEYCIQNRPSYGYPMSAPGHVEIEQIAEKLREQESEWKVYLSSLGDEVVKRDLRDACVQLLECPAFPADHRNFVQLEFLGIARHSAGIWQPRNHLIGLWLRDWLASHLQRSSRQISLTTKWLTGPQFGMALRVLCAAYDKDSLRIMLRTSMDVRLADVVEDKGMEATVYYLLEWAGRKGRLAELLRKAADDNLTNRDLQDLTKQLGAQN